MNTHDEILVQEEQQRRRVREEAVRRDTSGALSLARTMRWIGLGCALIPGIGIFATCIFMFIALATSIYLISKAHPDGVKQLFITLLSGLAGGLLFVLVTFIAAVLLNASIR